MPCSRLYEHVRLQEMSTPWFRCRVDSQIRLHVFESIFHIFPRLLLFLETVWFILPSCLSLMTVPAVTSCCVLDLKETESGAVGSGGGLTMFFSDLGKLFFPAAAWSILTAAPLSNMLQPVLPAVEKCYASLLVEP